MTRRHFNLGVAGLILAAALLPLILGTFATTLLNYIGIATLVALGLVLLTGSGGMTSFGQGAFVGIGAYTSAYLTITFQLSPWIGLIAALAITAIVAAAIGSAEQAVTSGVVKLPAGMKPEDATGMIALSYGITYIWGTVGIILICKYLPRWWGVDAKAAAKQYEAEFGVRDLEGGGLTGYRQFGLRAYRLENPAQVGRSIASFRKSNPEYRIVNVSRGGEQLGADPDLMLQRRWA